MANDYFKNLPKKRMAAGALIFNKGGEILFVKPSYKNYWSLPGGVIEADESPKKACLREVREEIGFDLKSLKFLCVDYISNKEDRGENLQFVFYGGKLSADEIKNIKIDGKEIVEYRFMKIDEALPLLNEKSKKRLPKCLEVLKKNNAIYLDKGE